MHSKPTMRYLCASSRMSKDKNKQQQQKKNLTIPSASEVVNNWKFQTLLGEMQNCIASLENNLAVSYKVKLSSPYDPAVPLLEIFPKK